MQSLTYSRLIIAAMLFIALVVSTCISSTVSAAPSGPYAYVTNNRGNVSVIDTQTNTIVANVSTGGTLPFAVAVNPAGTKVYVANYDRNNLAIIDAATNTVTTTVPIGASPFGVAVNAAGTKIYTTGERDYNLTVIDAATNNVTARVPMGWAHRVLPAGLAEAEEVGALASTSGYSYGIAPNPAGTKVYVANFWDGNVSVIDTAGNTVETVIQLGDSPDSMVMNSAGTKLFVTSASESNLTVINPDTNAVTAKIRVGSFPIAVALNPTGTRAYVANRDSGTVSVIDTATNTVIATVILGGRPFGVSVTPDGAKVYVSNFNSNNVSVIDAATNIITANVTVGAPTMAWGIFIAQSPPAPPAPPAPAPVLQVPLDVGVMFNVRDNSYTPIEGALVSVGDQNATSNNFGSYLVLTSGDNVTVNVSARGYANQSFPYLVSTGKTEPVTMQPAGAATTSRLIRLLGPTQITTGLRLWL